MLKYLFSLILISLSLTAIAQTDIDALNYSRWTSGATARSLAVGGAFGALGGDISTMNTNPAGLGVFRASEIALTPAFNLANVSADFNGNTVDTDKNKFRFAIGNPSPGESAIINWQIWIKNLFTKTLRPALS